MNTKFYFYYNLYLKAQSGNMSCNVANSARSRYSILHTVMAYKQDYKINHISNSLCVSQLIESVI